MSRISAHELVNTVLDAGTWTPWDFDVLQPTTVAADYADALAAARLKTGLPECLLVGEGRVGGTRVAVIAQEFDFLGGSLGVAATELLVSAVERATREGLPLLASPTSGGTRMQEGTVAFVQMIKIAQAINDHKAAGLPYLVYLRNPTTGGVLASFGSLGHVTVAEPGALIGFLGPRVYEVLTGDPFPAGVQHAENLFAHGIVDAVLAPAQLAPLLARALDVLLAGRAQPVPPQGAHPLAGQEPADVSAWEAIVRTRRPERPGVRALLREGAAEFVPLHGTGAGELDREVVIALARFGDARCIVIGQDRRNREVQPLGPGGLRTARRAMDIAAELGLPVVTVIDTAGAALSQQAEEAALAGEIARSLSRLVALPVPTLSLILGMGTGGGALALLPADRVFAAQHGWLSPLPPEGASAILHRTPDRAPEMAEQQGVRAAELLRNGIIDAIVPEYPDASDEPTAFCNRVATLLEHELHGLAVADRSVRRTQRHRRYREIGKVLS